MSDPWKNVLNGKSHKYVKNTSNADKSFPKNIKSSALIESPDYVPRVYKPKNKQVQPQSYKPYRPQISQSHEFVNEDSFNFQNSGSYETKDSQNFGAGYSQSYESNSKPITSQKYNVPRKTQSFQSESYRPQLSNSPNLGQIESDIYRPLQSEYQRPEYGSSEHDESADPALNEVVGTTQLPEIFTTKIESFGLEDVISPVYVKDTNVRNEKSGGKAKKFGRKRPVKSLFSNVTPRKIRQSISDLVKYRGQDSKYF